MPQSTPGPRMPSHILEFKKTTADAVRRMLREKSKGAKRGVAIATYKADRLRILNELKADHAAKPSGIHGTAKKPIRGWGN